MMGCVVRGAGHWHVGREPLQSVMKASALPAQFSTGMRLTHKVHPSEAHSSLASGTVSGLHR